MNLFDQPHPNLVSPLAERMRPRTLDDLVGQQHLVGPGKILRKLIESDQLTSAIFWGPPGTGKTSLGQIIANTTRSRFVFFSAVLHGVKELREVVAEARQERNFHGRRTVLFVDEIHRLNKAQQDAFLPFVERGEITLIGATTENPSSEVNSALLSRARVFVLHPLDTSNIRQLLQRALEQASNLKCYDKTLAEEALDVLAEQSQGDARVALNTLEIAITTSTQLDRRAIEDALQKKTLLYDKGAEEHYNVISAFIKSLRGSDPDGALYWLARMLEAGEDPLFIARRLVIMAAEDIGNADPRALQIAVASQQALHFVGMPEGRIPLAQATTYLATAPKSNAAYLGIDEALAVVRKSGALAVPMHIRNAPTKLMKELGYQQGYQYAHDYAQGYTPQEYLPEAIQGRKFYRPTEQGYEKLISERLRYWDGQKKEHRRKRANVTGPQGRVESESNDPADE